MRWYMAAAELVEKRPMAKAGDELAAGKEADAMVGGGGTMYKAATSDGWFRIATRLAMVVADEQLRDATMA